jgi:hypothetical protein
MQEENKLGNFLYLRDDGIIIGASANKNEMELTFPDGFQQTEESIIEAQEDQKRLDKHIRDIFMNGRHMNITTYLVSDEKYNSHIVNIMRNIKNKNSKIE